MPATATTTAAAHATLISIFQRNLRLQPPRRLSCGVASATPAAVNSRNARRCSRCHLGFVVAKFQLLPSLLALLVLLLCNARHASGQTFSEDDAQSLSTASTLFSTALLAGGSLDAKWQQQRQLLVFKPYAQRSYLSSIAQSGHNDTFSRSGMNLLYQSTNWLLDRLQPNDLPDYLLSDEEIQDVNLLWSSIKHNYAKWLDYEKGYIILASVCLGFAVLFTLALMICCLLRCCRKCCMSDKKSKFERSDRKGDTCRRLIGNTLVAVMSILSLLLIASAVVTNQHLHSTQLFRRLRDGLDDLSTYRDDVVDQVKHLLVRDYADYQTIVASTLNDSAVLVVNKVKEVTKATAIDELSNISNLAETLNRNVTSLQNAVIIAASQARDLELKLKSLEEHIRRRLSDCQQDLSDPAAQRDCQRVLTVLNERTVVPSFDQYIPFESIHRNISILLNAGISDRLKQGKEEFEKLQRVIDQKIDQHRLEVIQIVSSIGNDLYNISGNVAGTLRQVDLSEIKSQIDEYEDQFKTYEYYRWIACIVMCCCAGVCVLCFWIGVFFGVCGKRPDYYETDCCNRAVGSKFYAVGIFFGGIFMLKFMCTVVVLFLVGSNMQTAVCRPLQALVSKDINSSHALKLADRFVDIARHKIQLSKPLDDILHSTRASEVINGCKQNRTLYDTLHLNEQLGFQNLHAYNQKMHDRFDDFVNKVQQMTVDTQLNNLIPEDARQQLIALQNQELNIVSASNLQKLQNISDHISLRPHIDNLKSLRNDAARSLQPDIDDIVDQLTKLQESDVNRLSITVREILNNLSVVTAGIPDLKAKIPNLLSLLQHAEQLLVNNLTSYIRSEAKQLGLEILGYSEQYIQRVDQKLHGDITSCEPLRDILSSNVDALCAGTVDPLNGYWISFGVCILFWMPLIALALWLKKLYIHSQPYSASADYASYAASRRSTPYQSERSYKYKQNRINSNYSNWRQPPTNPLFGALHGQEPPPPYNGVRH